MSYKHTRKPLRAHRTRARSVRRRRRRHRAAIRGTQVRITAQLIDGADDTHLWSEPTQGELRNTLRAAETHRESHRRARFRVSLNPAGAGRAAQRGRPEPGRLRVVSHRDASSGTSARRMACRRALAYFQPGGRAGVRSYARAYSGLADTYALLGDWQYAVMTPTEALPKAKDCRRARHWIALDPQLGRPQLAGVLPRWLRLGLRVGRPRVRTRDRAQPGYADRAPLVCLASRARPALRRTRSPRMRKAQSLDPLSLVINADLAELLAPRAI
jgi:hypothetical protein